jgi:hypothetical protein
MNKFSIVKLAAVATTLLPGVALADVSTGAKDAKPTGAPSDLFSATGVFHTLANILIFITGAIAVLVVIFGGLTYVTSTGDAARVKRAKDTILYGIVGVVIAILAYAIVAFVVSSLGKAS